MSNEYAEEQIKLIEVNLARSVGVQHIKHVINLTRLQIGQVAYHVIELDV